MYKQQKIMIDYDKFFRIIGIVFCSLCLLFSLFYSKGDKETKKNDRITRVDTIIKRDTIIIDKPQPIYITKTKVVRDTLKTTDTIPQFVEVEVPIETKEYKDSSYYCRISGFQPFLEHLEVYPVQTTITKEITQYKAKKWNCGIQAGFGYGVFNKKPDLYIGIGVNYNIR